MQLVVVKVLFPTDCNDPDKSIAAAEAAALSLSLSSFFCFFPINFYSFLFHFFSCSLAFFLGWFPVRTPEGILASVGRIISHFWAIYNDSRPFLAILGIGLTPKSNTVRILVAFSFIYDCFIVVDIVATVVAITLACPLLTFRAHQQRILLANVEIRRDSVVF